MSIDMKPEPCLFDQIGGAMCTEERRAETPEVCGICGHNPNTVYQWLCDNCGAWVDDDGSGNDHEGYTCARCDSCMFPEELARFYADGDLDAKMTWRVKPTTERKV